jgi:hypothetical protein
VDVVCGFFADAGRLLASFLVAIGGIIYGFMQRRAKAKAIREAASEVVHLELSGRRSPSTALENNDPLLLA